MTKKISLIEAKKLATPGPLEVLTDKAGRACLYVKNTVFDVAVGMKPADAFLFKHLRNTHGELVEALEKAIKLASMEDDDFYKADDAGEVERVKAVLARAKTVEMP